MNIDPRPPGTKVPKSDPPPKHLIVRVEHETRGPHRNGRKRIRQIVLYACGKAVFGGIRDPLFAKFCTEEIAEVTCRRCIHEAKTVLDTEKPKEPKPAPLPPPIPIFHDPCADEDTPIGVAR